MLKNRILRRRLRQIGTSVDMSFLLYLNNESPMSFPNEDSLFKYVKEYRENNTIFNLQIYRIETYSL